MTKMVSFSLHFQESSMENTRDWVLCCPSETITMLLISHTLKQKCSNKKRVLTKSTV